jgi:hypothetical protein
MIIPVQLHPDTLPAKATEQYRARCAAEVI